MPVRIVNCLTHSLVAIPIIQRSIVIILDCMTLEGLMAVNIKITNVLGPEVHNRSMLH
jgi:hypothetical protein